MELPRILGQCSPPPALTHRVEVDLSPVPNSAWERPRASFRWMLLKSFAFSVPPIRPSMAEPPAGNLLFLRARGGTRCTEAFIITSEAIYWMRRIGFHHPRNVNAGHNTANIPRRDYSQNDFGATLGAPIVFLGSTTAAIRAFSSSRTKVYTSINRRRKPILYSAACARPGRKAPGSPLQRAPAIPTPIAALLTTLPMPTRPMIRPIEAGYTLTVTALLFRRM